MTVPKDVENLGRTARQFYIVCEILAILTMIGFKNQFSYSKGIRMLFESILAFYFYMLCTDSTGQPQEVESELELNRLSQSSVQNEPEQEQSQENIKLIPERNYCQICKQIQQYRTKHCSKCEKCIPKYDHHCFWVGGCVGELNHRVFWAFLLFQCILCWEGLSNFLTQMDFYLQVDEIGGHDKYQAPYFILLIFSVLCFGFALFTGALLTYHTMLIMSGKTTWEHTKRDKITYLKFYPKHYHPYDFGIIRNIKCTFLHRNKLQEWTPPNIDQITEQCNIFDNQYYNCC